MDAYGPEEQALRWYYYLEDQLRFPFQARCLAAQVVIAPEERGDRGSPVYGARGGLHERHARGDPLAGPPVGRTLVAVGAIDAEESTLEALADWQC